MGIVGKYRGEALGCECRFTVCYQLRRILAKPALQTGKDERNKTSTCHPCGLAYING